MGGSRRKESKGAVLLGGGSTALLPAPCLQCKQQALECSDLEMNEYTDRDQEKYLLHKVVGHSFPLNEKNHKKQQ